MFLNTLKLVFSYFRIIFFQDMNIISTATEHQPLRHNRDQADHEPDSSLS
jgi:hypothetical protein